MLRAITSQSESVRHLNPLQTARFRLAARCADQCRRRPRLLRVPFLISARSLFFFQFLPSNVSWIPARSVLVSSVPRGASACSHNCACSTLKLPKIFTTSPLSFTFRLVDVDWHLDCCLCHACARTRAHTRTHAHGHTDKPVQGTRSGDEDARHKQCQKHGDGNVSEGE